MKFSKQSLGNRNSIRSYQSDQVQVGDRTLTQSCLISADYLELWHARDALQLKPADFELPLQWQPEIILLGTGTRLQFPQPQLIANIMAQGIGFEVMDLGAACRTFNVLVAEDRRVVAALILGN
jgi:uncharacterized protein